jgi:hypothetical protein
MSGRFCCRSMATRTCHVTRLRPFLGKDFVKQVVNGFALLGKSYPETMFPPPNWKILGYWYDISFEIVVSCERSDQSRCKFALKKCGLTGAHIVSSAVNKSKFRDLGRFRDWPIKMGESLRSQETPTGHPVHHPWDRSRKAVPVPRSGRWFPLAQANSTFATFDVWPWGRFALHGREPTWETT